MRAGVADLLADAVAARSAVAAFNVYTLHQAAGVVDGAVRAQAPVILQVHPSGVRDLLPAMLVALNRLRDDAAVPIAVQLDHTTDLALVSLAIEAGVDAVMIDGSSGSLAENVALVARGRALAPREVAVEAELGRLSGSEDGASAPTGELTDPEHVASFLQATGADALAVSVGNVHGPTRESPLIDLVRLEAIARASTVPLVLHGASGLSRDVVRETIRRGVAKINVNSEIRGIYQDAIRRRDPELTMTLAAAREGVSDAVERIIRSLIGELSA